MSLLSLFVSVFNLVTTHDLNALLSGHHNHDHCAHAHKCSTSAEGLQLLKTNDSPRTQLGSSDHLHQKLDLSLEQTSHGCCGHANAPAAPHHHGHEPATAKAAEVCHRKSSGGSKKELGCCGDDVEEARFTRARSDSLERVNRSSIRGNYRAMIIHLFFDLISSLAVVVSCICVRYFETSLFDSVTAIGTSLMIMIACFPLLKQSVRNLRKRDYDFRILGLDEQAAERCRLRHLEINDERGRAIVVDLPGTGKQAPSDAGVREFCQKYGFQDFVLLRKGKSLKD